MRAFPRPFADAWTLDDTRHCLASPPFPKDGTFAEQDTWRREVLQPRNERLADAFGGHLAWAAAQGAVVVPPHTDHAHTPWLAALRGLLDCPDSEAAQRDAGLPFARSMMVQSVLDPAWQGGTPEETHARLLGWVEAGNFSHVRDPDTCRQTGVRFEIEFHGWNATAVQRQWGDGLRSTSVPVGPDTFQAPGTETVALPVPSGHLLVADWFRIPAFQALTQPLDREAPDAMDSIGGRAGITRRYAERLGVAHVFGCSPDVVAGRGAVTVGYLDVDGPRPAGLVGSIDASLRWTTLVDRQHLVALLAPALGSNGAEEAVAAYEAATPELLHVHVAPGTHHLYFAGDGPTFARTFDQAFDAGDLFLDEVLDDKEQLREEMFPMPLFALTEQPLPAWPTPTKARRPSP